jgi:predicted deacetylase
VSGETPTLIVSVHDIASSTAAETRWLLGRLDRIGVTRRVLKVVPRWKDVDDLRRDDGLASLLREESAAGSEVMVHGLTHALEGPPLGPWQQRLRVRLGAPKDAEFAGYDVPASVVRLRTALDDLRAVGLASPGLCPPGWIAPAALDADLRPLGLRYVVRASSIHDLVEGRSRSWPAAGYMGVGGTVERFYELQREVTVRTPFRRDVLRIYLHPQGAPDSPACGRALRRIRSLARERCLATYADLLTPDPPSAGPAG